ncbi:hypothetical protein SBOR_6300 [Sclerotinia borealis F-4128]|uniref:Uncharacterized protein n=1 Tax=Sclerotinia borealis (strain F-4128) TaxID=1432307 RepID=W9CEX7_SCLBF|nr:hypothetical protein SBOR_6300 [Sclerotinia borealis F-4128]
MSVQIDANGTVHPVSLGMIQLKPTLVENITNLVRYTAYFACPSRSSNLTASSTGSNTTALSVGPGTAFNMSNSSLSVSSTLTTILADWSSPTSASSQRLRMRLQPTFPQV